MPDHPYRVSVHHPDGHYTHAILWTDSQASANSALIHRLLTRYPQAIVCPQPEE